MTYYQKTGVFIQLLEHTLTTSTPGALSETTDNFDVVKCELFEFFDSFRDDINHLGLALRKVYSSRVSIIVLDYIIHIVSDGFNLNVLAHLLRGLSKWDNIIPSYALLLLYSKGCVTVGELIDILTIVNHSATGKCPAKDISAYLFDLESASVLIHRFALLSPRYAITLAIFISIISEEKARVYIEALVTTFGIEAVFSELCVESGMYNPQWMLVPERLLFEIKPLREYKRDMLTTTARFDYLVHCQDSQV